MMITYSRSEVSHVERADDGRGAQADHHGGPLERVCTVHIREDHSASTEGSVSVPDREEKVGLNVLGRSEVGPFHTRPPRQCSATWTCSPGWRRRRPSCRVWHDAEGGHDGWTRKPSHRSIDIRGV